MWSSLEEYHRPPNKKVALQLLASAAPPSGWMKSRSRRTASGGRCTINRRQKLEATPENIIASCKNKSPKPGKAGTRQDTTRH